MTNDTYPDPAAWAERITDAGTKPYPPRRPEQDPDEAYDRQREREDAYRALRAMAVAALAAALTACGAGLEEVDDRPVIAPTEKQCVLNPALAGCPVKAPEICAPPAQQTNCPLPRPTL